MAGLALSTHWVVPRCVQLRVIDVLSVRTRAHGQHGSFAQGCRDSDCDSTRAVFAAHA